MIAFYSIISETNIRFWKESPVLLNFQKWYCSFLFASLVLKWFSSLLCRVDSFKLMKKKQSQKHRWCIYRRMNHLRSNIFSRTNFLFLAALGAKSFIIPSFLVTVQSSTETNQQNVNNVIKLPLFNMDVYKKSQHWPLSGNCQNH